MWPKSLITNEKYTEKWIKLEEKNSKKNVVDVVGYCCFLFEDEGGCR